MFTTTLPFVFTTFDKLNEPYRSNKISEIFVLSKVIYPDLFPKRFEETEKDLTVQYFLVWLGFSHIAF